MAHARARTVRLGLLYEPEAVSLLVQDDGQGFDPRSGGRTTRFGLRAMADRAQRTRRDRGRRLAAGWGTRIRARFPYTRDAEPARARPAGAGGRAAARAAAGLARLLALDRTRTRGDRRGRHGGGGRRGLPGDAPRGGPGRPRHDSRRNARGEPRSDGGSTGGGSSGGRHHRAADRRASRASRWSASATRARSRRRAGRHGDAGQARAAAWTPGADGPELARAVAAAARGQAILSGPDAPAAAPRPAQPTSPRRRSPTASARCAASWSRGCRTRSSPSGSCCR